MKPKRINYLEQGTIRAAIHDSKKSFNWYAEDRYADFDVCVSSVSEVTPANARSAMEQKAFRATKAARAQAREHKGRALTPSESDALQLTAQHYQVSDVVFRVSTDEHVTDDPEARGARKRSGKVEVNFPPFKHYICDDTGALTEVGRSHWEGSLDNGHFSTTHGKLTNKLGKIYMLLVERYGRKGNWRGYSYNDEMQAVALETLCANGLKFDESKSDNAFAYLTVIAQNSFTRVLNTEKKHQQIRDDIMQDMGATPSMTRQVDNELATQKLLEERTKRPRGRPADPNKPKPIRTAPMTREERSAVLKEAWARRKAAGRGKMPSPSAETRAKISASRKRTEQARKEQQTTPDDK